MSIRSLRNRALIASGLLFSMSAAFTTAAFAETFTTDNAAVRNLTVTPATLNLSNSDLGAAVTDESIGTVNVQSNAGFKVEVSSGNNSKFVNGSDEIPYTFKYNSAGVTLSSTGTTAETNASMVAACNDAGGCDRTLEASIAAGARYGLPAGNYTDTLTFTISAP